MHPLAFFGTAFVSLFLVVDVATNMPIFLSLTEKYSAPDRRIIARTALLVALGIQLLFVIFGNYIFGYLNIKLYSFSIAGGILLSIVAMEMLFGRKSRTEYQEKEQQEEKENITIVPLAIPLHTGPAAIITGMIIFGQADTLLLKGVFVLATVCVYLASMLILFKSDIIFKIFKPLGMKVITRVMGLILLTLAVQFVVNGIKEALG
ncbi:MAG: MarC family protein [Candidatus Zixiibacteriota bacterium]|jgi:multiple antibiotic resistance protein